MRSYENNRNARISFPQPDLQFRAVHARHANVQNEAGTFRGCARFEEDLRRFESQDAISRGSQQSPHGVSH